MATKPPKRNAVVKKFPTAKSTPKATRPAKISTASKAVEASSSEEQVFNAETARVLRDADAGKNLTSYVDEDDLFRKLGIKIGKAKA